MDSNDSDFDIQCMGILASVMRTENWVFESEPGPPPDVDEMEIDEVLREPVVQLSPIGTKSYLSAGEDMADFFYEPNSNVDCPHVLCDPYDSEEEDTGERLRLDLPMSCRDCYSGGSFLKKDAELRERAQLILVPSPRMENGVPDLDKAILKSSQKENQPTTEQSGSDLQENPSSLESQKSEQSHRTGPQTKRKRTRLHMEHEN